MHQIRVHLASIGHAVLGDAVYGPPVGSSGREARAMLHAAVLGFVHPTTGGYVEFRAPMPADMAQAVQERRAVTTARPAD